MSYMAFVRLIHAASHVCRVAFLVDAAVGRGGANRRDDVLLIQFMLNNMWGRLNPGTHKTFGALGTSPPVVDGLCGPKTIGAIEAFQKVYFPRPELADGRVNAVRPGSSLSFAGGEVRYTIILLNVAYGHHFGIERHHFIGHEPGCPSELQMAFYV
jgi:hypothetical protein